MNTPQTGNTALPLAQTTTDSMQAVFEDMTHSLTVVYAQAQLLRRRLAAGRVTDPQECLQALERIEHSAEELVRQLHEAHEASSARPAAVVPSRRIA